MAEPVVVDFWFSIGSTYSYLSIMRLDEVQQGSGVGFRWRPFSVRRIMREMDNRFLAGKPEKYRYMWRDIARRAAARGIVANVPVPHPIKELDFANQVAVLGFEEGWGAEYVRATYRRWFTEGLEPGSDPNLSASLREAGQAPDRVCREAQSAHVLRLYDEATTTARQLGVF